MMKFFLSATVAFFFFVVASPAQTIVLPKLPTPALSFFKTSEPVSFEVQTAAPSPSNAMTYWQGTVSISSTGNVTGNGGIGTFANSITSGNSTVSKFTLSGKISNPRVAWSNEESGAESSPGYPPVAYKYRSADYVADLFVKTNAPSSFIIKGALIYRHRVSYRYDTYAKKTVADDHSYVDVRACAFGPNGQVGYVIQGGGE
jgi:hypothetical protein